jgi:hypothetical protein
MKLKRLRVLPSVKLAGRVSGELNETLPAYQGYYRHLHGEAIEPWPLGGADAGDVREQRPAGFKRGEGDPAKPRTHRRRSRLEHERESRNG